MPKTFDFRNTHKDNYDTMRFDGANKDKNIRERNRNDKTNSLPIIKPNIPINRTYENKNQVLEERKKNQFNKAYSSTIKDVYKTHNFF
tara:strand:+ start:65 stop:328 length:264 start_codon:yes stop_codon:yes gene_type:complete